MVAIPHWGFEYNRLPMPYDILFAYKMIDASAETIIGSHPHCVQPKEVYKGKKYIIRLGIFIFQVEERCLIKSLMKK